MSQSDIQSYIQQLAGTHTLGQSNLPSGVNNGNPNTVYNVSPPQGGYLPPVSNAYDQWRINPAGPASTPVNWQQLSQQGGFGINLAGMAPKPMAGTPGVPTTPFPGTGGGTTPPPSTGGTTPPTSTGGGLPPTQTGGTGIGGGGYGGGGTIGGKGADWYDFGGDRSSLASLGFSDKPIAGGVQSTSASDPAGWGGLNTNDISSMLGTGLPLGEVGKGLFGTPLGNAIGVKADGSISLGEILDWVVPGNIYMGQTGKINLLNAIPGLLSKVSPVLGMAAKTAMQWLAKKFPNNKVLANWAKMNQDNYAAGHGGGGNGGPAGGGTAGTGLDGLSQNMDGFSGSGVHGSMYGSPFTNDPAFLNDNGLTGMGDLFGDSGSWGPFFSQDQGDVNQR